MEVSSEMVWILMILIYLLKLIARQNATRILRIAKDISSIILQPLLVTSLRVVQDINLLNKQLQLQVILAIERIMYHTLLMTVCVLLTVLLNLLQITHHKNQRIPKNYVSLSVTKTRLVQGFISIYKKVLSAKY